MSTSIKISELNDLPVITNDDFFPIVDSGSLTTYRTQMTTISTWIANSGSVVSSSWSSASLSASHAIRSDTASYLTFTPNAISASWASHSFSSEINISSSWASHSFLSDTASYFNFTLPNNVPYLASQSLVATQSLFATQSLVATQSLYATNSLYATSASWASSSVSSSHALVADTASFAFRGPGIAQAWAIFVVPTASNGSTNNAVNLASNNITNKPRILGGYNVSDVSWAKFDVLADPGFLYGLPAANVGDMSSTNFLITLTNPLSSTTMSLIGTGGEQNGLTSNRNAETAYFYIFPFGKRTTSAFTMSAGQYGMNSSGVGEQWFFSFEVFAV